MTHEFTHLRKLMPGPPLILQRGKCPTRRYPLEKPKVEATKRAILDQRDHLNRQTSIAFGANVLIDFKGTPLWRTLDAGATKHDQGW
ncbi:hypothetical protein CRG98_016475 [Punica granatum]|uniref:Uncharacterized protein n=1 Tax=Punica granatum TaxID=22663 RepID=A0A2I0K4R8_PUNGR|nr:hypothetical protein CRG98_016475 [Punica granatum]